jgi:hypothetical protein
VVIGMSRISTTTQLTRSPSLSIIRSPCVPMENDETLALGDIEHTRFPCESRKKIETLSLGDIENKYIYRTTLVHDLLVEEQDSSAMDTGEWEFNEPLPPYEETGNTPESSDDESVVSESPDAGSTFFQFGKSTFRLNDSEWSVMLPVGLYSKYDTLDIFRQLTGLPSDLGWRFSRNTDDPDRIELGVDNVISVSLPLQGGRKPRINIKIKTQQPKKQRARIMPRVQTKLKVVQVNNPPARTGLSTQFANAIKKPFSPSSVGCKVPDTFSLPTITAKVHYEVQLGTTAGNSVCGITIFPNPMVSYSLNAGIATSGLTAFTGITSLFYFVSRTTLDYTFDMYRVVSMGVKISNLIAPLSATGRWIFTPLLLGGLFMGFDALNSTVTSSSQSFYLLATTGVSAPQSISSSILQKPNSVEISVQDLLSQSYSFSMIPTSQVFYKFKNCGSAVYNIGSNLNIVENGEQIYSSSTGVIAAGTVSEFTDNMDMTGGIALNILGEGLPNVTSTACLQIEVVVHLEGTPSINSAVNALCVSGAQPLVGSTEQVEAALGDASKGGFLQSLKKGFEFAQNAASNPYVQEAAYMAMGRRMPRNLNRRIKY